MDENDIEDAYASHMLMLAVLDTNWIWQREDPQQKIMIYKLKRQLQEVKKNDEMCIWKVREAKYKMFKKINVKNPVRRAESITQVVSHCRVEENSMKRIMLDKVT